MHEHGESFNILYDFSHESLVLSEHSGGCNAPYIFHIFFPQDFESDGELRQMLEDFLHNIVDKSPIESPEYTGALHLLE